MDKASLYINKAHQGFACFLQMLSPNARMAIFVFTAFLIVLACLLIVSGTGKKHKRLANKQFISGIILAAILLFLFVIAWLL